MVVFCCTGEGDETTVEDRSTMVEPVVVSCGVGFPGSEVDEVFSSIL
jgi:hypothetical protein